ncbi:hypothetical protein GMB86_11440 [Terrilactibacillus sp. BCM23-1]|uniref:MBL fold metallo-hydrolase n=1 Tax=Terrilactibacillus tamarindi TaxID=2599694 RepID=A0A6N8CQV3_9BACI|nr:hypothetical protein [Terrilactibacillus tamarindi]MTT32619.1 hypothetical protein [Terrilactibacillus tamarindi]
MKRFAWIIGLLCFLFSYASLTYAKKEVVIHFKNDQIAISFLKLSNGEATLIQEANRTTLINTGAKSSRNELFNWLDKYGVKKIDALIITKVGRLYTGNKDILVKKYHIKQYIAPKLISKDQTFSKLKNIGKLKIDVMNERPEGANLLLSYGRKHMYYLSVPFEWTNKKTPQANIIKIDHFGLKSRLDSTWINQLDPEMVVIFKKKGYRASPELCRQLQSNFIDVYNLMETGTVLILLSPNDYRVYSIP